MGVGTPKAREASLCNGTRKRDTVPWCPKQSKLYLFRSSTQLLINYFRVCGSWAVTRNLLNSWGDWRSPARHCHPAISVRDWVKERWGLGGLLGVLSSTSQTCAHSLECSVTYLISSKEDEEYSPWRWTPGHSGDKPVRVFMICSNQPTGTSKKRWPLQWPLQATGAWPKGLGTTSMASRKCGLQWLLADIPARRDILSSRDKKYRIRIMWVSKLHQEPAWLGESGGWGERRAGVPTILLLLAGWPWAAVSVLHQEQHQPWFTRGQLGCKDWPRHFTWFHSHLSVTLSNT